MPGEYIRHWPHLSETRVMSQVAWLEIFLFLSPLTLANTVFVPIFLEPIQYEVENWWLEWSWLDTWILGEWGKITAHAAAVVAYLVDEYLCWTLVKFTSWTLYFGQFLDGNLLKFFLRYESYLARWLQRVTQGPAWYAQDSSIWPSSHIPHQPQQKTDLTSLC